MLDRRQPGDTYIDPGCSLDGSTLAAQCAQQGGRLGVARAGARREQHLSGRTVSAGPHDLNVLHAGIYAELLHGVGISRADRFRPVTLGNAGQHEGININVVGVNHNQKWCVDALPKALCQ